MRCGGPSSCSGTTTYRIMPRIGIHTSILELRRTARRAELDTTTLGMDEPVARLEAEARRATAGRALALRHAGPAVGVQPAGSARRTGEVVAGGVEEQLIEELHTSIIREEG